MLKKAKGASLKLEKKRLVNSIKTDTRFFLLRKELIFFKEIAK